jgi:hypothetical protein
LLRRRIMPMMYVAQLSVLPNDFFKAKSLYHDKNLLMNNATSLSYPKLLFEVTSEISSPRPQSIGQFSHHTQSRRQAGLATLNRLSGTKTALEGFTKVPQMTDSSILLTAV